MNTNNILQDQLVLSHHLGWYKLERTSKILRMPVYVRCLDAINNSANNKFLLNNIAVPLLYVDLFLQIQYHQVCRTSLPKMLAELLVIAVQSFELQTTQVSQSYENPSFVKYLLERILVIVPFNAQMLDSMNIQIDYKHMWGSTNAKHSIDKRDYVKECGCMKNSLCKNFLALAMLTLINKTDFEIAFIEGDKQ